MQDITKYGKVSIWSDEGMVRESGIAATSSVFNFCSRSGSESKWNITIDSIDAVVSVPADISTWDSLNRRSVDFSDCGRSLTSTAPIREDAESLLSIVSRVRSIFSLSNWIAVSSCQALLDNILKWRTPNSGSTTLILGMSETAIFKGNAETPCTIHGK